MSRFISQWVSKNFFTPPRAVQNSRRQGFMPAAGNRNNGFIFMKGLESLLAKAAGNHFSLVP